MHLLLIQLDFTLALPYGIEAYRSGNQNSVSVALRDHLQLVYFWTGPDLLIQS